MKILILKNEQFNTSDDIKQIVDYFKSHNIDLEFTIKKVTELVSVHMYTKRQGFNWQTGKPELISYMGLDNITKDRSRQYVKEGEYDIVVFSWDVKDLNQTLRGDEIVTSFTNILPLYNGTEFIQLAINDFSMRYFHKLSHEIMHALCSLFKRKGKPVLDEMDITSTGEAFKENDNPYSSTGNYARTFKNLEPYIGRSYKWFSDKEVKFLDLEPDFQEMLDNAREYAGISFVGTSGRRSKEKNKQVGGSPTSAHLDGTGVDIRARNWTEVFKIVDGAMKAGILGITVYTKSKHVHLDMKSNRLEVLNK